MTRSEPTSFARQYLKQICSLGTQAKYRSDPLWTVVAKQAAVKVCKEAGLLTQHEYLRLDVCGYRKIGKYPYQKRVEVAFEVEAGTAWKNELYKLSHVAADLCVLTAYEHHKGWSAVSALRHYLRSKILREQILRVSNRQWLFLFGPPWMKLDQPWSAFTLDEAGKVVALSELGDACRLGYEVD